jgi:uncharacterized protein (UPF0254 family)
MPIGIFDILSGKVTVVKLVQLLKISLPMPPLSISLLKVYGNFKDTSVLQLLKADEPMVSKVSGNSDISIF